ncbi:MAG: SDR family NAD(P)-dependent oxidoreductase, partial [Microbacterium aurantiacum]
MVQQSSAVAVEEQPQVALVTGSSGGIGAAAVDALQARGDIVVGADRVPLEGQLLGGFHELDVTDEAQTAALVHQLAAEYGRIDVLVH